MRTFRVSCWLSRDQLARRRSEWFHCHCGYTVAGPCISKIAPWPLMSVLPGMAINRIIQVKCTNTNPRLAKMNPQPVVFKNKCQVNFLGDATLGWGDTFYSLLVGACDCLCYSKLALFLFNFSRWFCSLSCLRIQNKKVVKLHCLLSLWVNLPNHRWSYHKGFEPSSMWLFLVGVIPKHRPRMVTGEGTTHRFKCAQALPVTTCLGTTASPAWANGREVIAPGQTNMGRMSGVWWCWCLWVGA